MGGGMASRPQAMASALMQQQPSSGSGSQAPMPSFGSYSPGAQAMPANYGAPPQAGVDNPWQNIGHDASAQMRAQAQPMGGSPAAMQGAMQPMQGQAQPVAPPASPTFDAAGQPDSLDRRMMAASGQQMPQQMPQQAPAAPRQKTWFTR
jgi:hypothetical protein